jgi:hypothetical protein
MLAHVRRVDRTTLVLNIVLLMGIERGSTLRFTGGLAAYVAGTLIAAAGQPGAALAVYGLTAVYYVFEHLPSPAAAQPPAPGAGN